MLEKIKRLIVPSFEDEDLNRKAFALNVIALSGLPEARHEALAAGADDFVSKGDPPEKLLAAVEGYVRKRKDA